MPEPVKYSKSDDDVKKSAFGSSTLLVRGGIGTVLYVAFLLLLIFLGPVKIEQLDLNELGDFLAGVFAPLAFLWLVLGFIQQGIELRQNSEALRLQVEELRQTAEHAGAMVKHAHEEAIRQRAQELHSTISFVQPAFSIAHKIIYNNNRETPDSSIIWIKNTGHEAHIELIQVSDALKRNTNNIELIRAYSGPCPSGSNFDIHVRHSFDDSSHANLQIFYKDQRGKNRIAIIKFTISRESIESGPIVHQQFDEVEELLGKLKD